MMPPSSRARRQLGLSSLAIHGGGDAGERTPFAEPAAVVERRLAAMEGAESALVTASGTGATALALLALLRPGDHLLASAWIYGAVHTLLTQEFDRYGIAVTLVDPLESRGWRKRLRKETRVIFIESPVNPTCRVIDLRPVNLLTKELGLALVIDSTFAGPINFRPIEHGADVVIQSNVILGSAPVIEEARDKMALWGQIPDPFTCWRLERDLETLSVRTARQNESAMRIAAWAAERKEIKRVHYAGLASHEDHAIAKHHMAGFGAMLGLELGGGARAADKFVRRLALWTNAAQGFGSMVSEPRFTTHADAKHAIPDGFVRLSTGLEDADDLIADVEQALR